MKKGNLLTFSTGRGDERTNEYGIIQNHAYAIIDTVILYHNGNPIYYLYKVFNPFKDDSTYNATFHDGDKRWGWGTPAFKDQINENLDP